MNAAAAAGFAGAALACSALVWVRKRRGDGEWHVTPRGLCEELDVVPIRSSPFNLWHSGSWIRLGAVYFGPESVARVKLHVRGAGAGA